MKLCVDEFFTGFDTKETLLRKVILKYSQNSDNALSVSYEAFKSGQLKEFR